MARTLTLGGRTFESFSAGTLEHELFVSQRIRAAGLDDCRLVPGESPPEYGERLLGKLLDAGPSPVLELLAAWMVPAGMQPTDWSPRMAAATAEHLAKLTDAADKASVRYLVLELLIDFFVRGTSSLRSSGRYSEPARPETVMEIGPQ